MVRWTPGGISRNIEDRRGQGGFGGFGRGPTIGCGGAIILLVLSLLTGRNFFSIFDGGGGSNVEQPAPGPTVPVQETPEEKRAMEYVSVVLDDTQSMWARMFQEQGAQYQDAKLVIFRDMTQSPCGVGQAASGPFYCPRDGKVYLDLGFFDELDRRFGAPGDFAEAYVLAHEIGHHVQNLTGVSDKVHEAMQSDRSNAGEYSVRLELQADCYAGIWANQAAKKNMLEPGDAEEGLAAAAAVGDDRIQKMSGRAVNPESWTHGSSEQRMEWFTRGFRSGQTSDCDTFR